MWRLRARVNDRGDCDVLDYIEALENRRRAVVIAHLMRLRKLEPPEVFWRVRTLGGGLFECRPPNDRILLCFGPWPRSIVLLRAHPKQKGKAPKQELDAARRLKKEAEELCQRGGEPWPEIEPL